MKFSWIVLGALMFTLVACKGEQKEVESGTNENTEVSRKSEGGFDSEMDSVSYALGFSIADSFTKQKVKGLNSKELEKGYNDFGSGQMKMDPNLSMKMFQEFATKHQNAMQQDSTGVSFETSYLDSVSYALGIGIAQNYKQLGVENINSSLLSDAFEDVSNGSSKMSEEVALNLLQVFGQKQQALQAEKSKAQYAKNIEEGQSFLSENGKRPEVTTLPSGLQYEIIKEGNGEIPTMTNTVLADYHGTLINGSVFDSSLDKQPIEFGVGGVIKGWTEALKLMPVGSKWKLYIPYDLAYGERGAGAQIPPYSTLIFDVELLKIVK